MDIWECAIGVATLRLGIEKVFSVIYGAGVSGIYLIVDIIMIKLISFSFMFVTNTQLNKIVRWQMEINNVQDIIINVTASELAIDENGQRLFWINNGNNRRYILAVSFLYLILKFNSFQIGIHLLINVYLFCHSSNP